MLKNIIKEQIDATVAEGLERSFRNVDPGIAVPPDQLRAVQLMVAELDPEQCVSIVVLACTRVPKTVKCKKHGEHKGFGVDVCVALAGPSPVIDASLAALETYNTFEKSFSDE